MSFEIVFQKVREKKKKCKEADDGAIVQSRSLEVTDRSEDQSTVVEFITRVSMLTVNAPFHTHKGCSPQSGVGERMMEEWAGGGGGACPQDLLSSYMSSDAWMSGSSISQTTLRGDTELRLKK